MNFGAALEQLKNGFKVQRIGWNGKGMWLAHVPADQWGIGKTEIFDMNGPGKMLPWIGMKTVDDKFVPWLASQTDILAEDWQLVD